METTVTRKQQETLVDWPWRQQSQENDKRQLAEQPWRWQSMLGDRIKLRQMQWKIETKGKPVFLCGIARWTSWGMSTTTRKHNEKQARENQRVQAVGWNWYLVLWHAKEYTETAMQENCKKQVQQELARQQAQWRGGCWSGVWSKQGGDQAEDSWSSQASQAGWSCTRQDLQIPCWPHRVHVNP